MQRRIQHIIALTVLVSYVLVGAIGFWGLLGDVLSYGTRQYLITQSGPSSPPPVKVVWTQQKHYPSSSKDNVPAPALVSEHGISSPREYDFVGVEPSVNPVVYYHASGLSPRAPPQA